MLDRIVTGPFPSPTPSPPYLCETNSRWGFLTLWDVEEMLALHRGQGLELFWRDSLTCPTEEEYVKMVLGSTSPPPPPLARLSDLVTDRHVTSLFSRDRRVVQDCDQAHDGQIVLRRVSPPPLSFLQSNL